MENVKTFKLLKRILLLSRQSKIVTEYVHKIAVKT